MGSIRTPFEGITGKTIDLADPLVAEEEVARMLGISVRTLQRLRKARKIAYVAFRRAIFFRKSAVERFLDRCTVPER